MDEKRYIHIRNWPRFQHPDTTRARSSAIPWIKSYTGQLGDEDYVALGWADRGLLESLRLQYATNRGRGINDSTTNLFRLFGQRVLRVQLERLNHAGFIEFSASKTLAACKQVASPEEETEREEETEKNLSANPGLTAPRHAGKGPGTKNSKTEGAADANGAAGPLPPTQADANGPEPTPSPGHGPLRDAVLAELAKTRTENEDVW